MEVLPAAKKDRVDNTFYLLNNSDVDIYYCELAKTVRVVVSVNIIEEKKHAKSAEAVVYVNIIEEKKHAKTVGVVVSEHNRIKTCKDCGGSSICAHGRQRSQCRLSSYCKHNRLKITKHIVVYVNTIEKRVDAKTAEAVVYVNIIESRLLAKAAEVVVYVNIIDKRVNVKSAEAGNLRQKRLK